MVKNKSKCVKSAKCGCHKNVSETLVSETSGPGAVL